jgi:hypothetical protein
MLVQKKFVKEREEALGMNSLFGVVSLIGRIIVTVDGGLNESCQGKKRWGEIRDANSLIVFYCCEICVDLEKSQKKVPQNKKNVSFERKHKNACIEQLLEKDCR